jgi:hypothetical protein
MLWFKAVSTHYMWGATDALDLLKLAGMIVGLLSLWFLLAFALSGGLARGSRPVCLLAFCMGFAVACLLGVTFVVDLHRIWGAFLGPLAAGAVCGRASWPRGSLERGKLVPNSH